MVRDDVAADRGPDWEKSELEQNGMWRSIALNAFGNAIQIKKRCTWTFPELVGVALRQERSDRRVEESLPLCVPVQRFLD
jgi:hypothetical protein